MLFGAINLLPGVIQTLLIGLSTSFLVLNCQLVELVDIYANRVFKSPGICYFILLLFLLFSFLFSYGSFILFLYIAQAF